MPSSEPLSDLPLSFVLAVIGSDDEEAEILEEFDAESEAELNAAVG